MKFHKSFQNKTYEENIFIMKITIFLQQPRDRLYIHENYYDIIF